MRGLHNQSCYNYNAHFATRGLSHVNAKFSTKPQPSHASPHPSQRSLLRPNFPLTLGVTHAYSSSSISKGLLRSKTAIITGSSRGIGKAIAERFAAEGARCVLVGRDEGRLIDVRNSLAAVQSESRESLDHVIRTGDVGDRAFWRRLRGEKPIDILVNAAGITHYSPLFATTEELLEKIMITNLMGTVLGCKTIGKFMMSNANGGCIINISSLLGLKGGKGSAGYVASKAGVIGFTRALAAEVGKSNIRVNVILPGYIETDMTAAMTPEARSEALEAIPLQRFGEASEIADAAFFLATNKYASNCMLNLDGGLSSM